MKSVLLFLILSTLVASAQRRSSPLNESWQFHLGDVPAAFTGNFDASDWDRVDVPHDWSFENGVSRKGAQSDKGGYYSGGIGWYRKSFTLAALRADQRVCIDFDGVYMNSEVWVNGQKLGKRPYGYISFSYDITASVKPGANVIAVRCDNSREPSARWYHPCGIYAPVQLTLTHQSHILKDGIQITTPRITHSRAEVQIQTSTSDDRHTKLQHIILDPSGKEVARTTGNQAIVHHPKRWDLETPHLYTLVTRLSKNGTLVDEVRTRFGIRSIQWEIETGFWLNETNVKLLGVCEHWEGGPVGGAWTPELMRWKIKTLQSMGCNAIRTAHNPCPPFFYDLCDELGMLVMDELFDGWKTKAPHDYGRQAFASDWELDLRSWLKRDRNHPCIIIWSIGNETGGPVAADLVKVCHELDPSRLVTSGHSGSNHMDVLGMNGSSEFQSFYLNDQRDKNKPFVATEAPHTWQVRGYYRTQTWFRDGYSEARKSAFPLADLTPTEIFTYDWIAPSQRSNRKQIFNSSYDNATVRITARQNWQFMRDLPWYSGHFRWTGFDYPGEAGYVHGGWPFRAFMGGSHDLAGFPKDLAYFYQSQWTKVPMVHLLPSWTHPKMKPGTLIPVWAYSNADEVELYLNGKSLGIDRPGKHFEEMQCQWMVPWEPGTLTAFARTEGKDVASTTQTTAGVPAALLLTAEIYGETRVVTTTLTDDQGTTTPYADNRIHYHLDGSARLHSHENGNPVDTDNGTTMTSRRAFMGKTRSFIRLTGESASTLTAVAILGSRNGVTSPTKQVEVTIDRKVLVLDGATSAPPNYADTLRFTTDGSEPTSSSPVYQQPFTITLPTIVKAVVHRDGTPILSLSEAFAADQGLYWGNPDGQNNQIENSGEQAESAKLSNGATITAQGQGFQGQSFVDLPRKGARIHWYQENDGAVGQFKLKFRFTNGDPKGARIAALWINGKQVETLSFKKTGSWTHSWQTLACAVTLKAGANDIMLVAGSSGGPSIDTVIVSE